MAMPQRIKLILVYNDKPQKFFDFWGLSSPKTPGEVLCVCWCICRLFVRSFATDMKNIVKEL